ncbi:phenylacetate--CoA ligase family protein [Salinispira pacifica]
MVTFLIDRILRLLQRRSSSTGAAGRLVRFARAAWRREGEVEESDADFGAGLLYHLVARRLRGAIRYAARNSAYYGDLFEQRNIRYGEVRSPADLADLPITDVGALSDWRRMLAVPEEEVAVTVLSAGTAGPARTVAFTVEDWNQVCAARAAALGLLLPRGRSSLRRGLGALVMMPAGSEMWAERRAVSDALRRLGAQLFEGTTDQPEEAVRWLVDFEPDLIVGTPFALDTLTWCAAEVGFSYRPTALTTVGDAAGPIVTSRILAHWGVKPTPAYGTAETGGAQTLMLPGCRGVHLNDLDFVFEIVDTETGEPAAAGDLLVTTLLRRAMPLVRYRTGDRARRVQHSCRLPFSNVQLLGDGREIEWHGARVPVRELSETLLSIDGLSGRFLFRYPIGEDAAELVAERAVCGPGAGQTDDEIVRLLETAIRRALPPSAPDAAPSLELTVTERLSGQIRYARIDDEKRDA